MIISIKWFLHGFMSMAGNYLLMMFYTTVSGWMLHYFFGMVKGSFEGKDPEAIGKTFGEMLADPVKQVGGMAVVVIIGFAVISRGLQKGLEKVTKIMMMALLSIMGILAVNSVFMKGSAEGIGFYLLPDVAKIRNIGFFKVVVAAMNQAFFTLSIGMGSVAIFGSHIGNDRSLMRESNFLDLFDFLVSTIILPVGSLIFVLFCTSKYGWGGDAFVKEANKGKGVKVIDSMRFYMAYILPLIVFALIVIGLID